MVQGEGRAEVGGEGLRGGDWEFEEVNLSYLQATSLYRRVFTVRTLGLYRYVLFSSIPSLMSHALPVWARVVFIFLSTLDFLTYSLCLWLAGVGVGRFPYLFRVCYMPYLSLFRYYLIDRLPDLQHLCSNRNPACSIVCHRRQSATHTIAGEY